VRHRALAVGRDLHDGLSTRDQVSDISGRGVGLSALAEVVIELGGEVSVKSEAGRGTTLTFWFAAPMRQSSARLRPRSSLVPHFV